MTTANRVVLYLQDETNLAALPGSIPPLTHLNLSSFHFGYDSNNQPYIHLNNIDPGQSTVWPAMQQAQKAGCKVLAMLGGAGGAYGQLFSNYSAFYGLLKQTLQTYNLDGVDLDIEESVTLTDVQKLIKDLRKDFPNGSISAAPVAMALWTGSDPLSGLDWSKLESDIDWFNVQFYSGYGSLSSPADYMKIVNAGYPVGKVLAGHLTNPGNGSGYVAISTVVSTITSLIGVYGNTLGGAMGWEQYNAMDSGGKVDPAKWCKDMYKALTS